MYFCSCLLFLAIYEINISNKYKNQGSSWCDITKPDQFKVDCFSADPEQEHIHVELFHICI